MKITNAEIVIVEASRRVLNLQLN